MDTSRRGLCALLLLLSCGGDRVTAAQVHFGDRQTVDPTPDWGVAIVPADIDRDGDLDLVSGVEIYEDKSVFHRIYWHRNDGNRSFGRRFEILTEATSSLGGLRDLAVVDVDRDGDPDVVAAFSWSDTVVWIPNTDGAGTFGAPLTISDSASYPNLVDAADLDRDGDLDVIVGSEWFDNGEDVVWYENLGWPGFDSVPRTVTTQSDYPTAVALGDIDGDGDADAVVASWYDLGWIENADGHGSFGFRRLIADAWITDLAGLALGDVDGDGDLDVLVAIGNPYGSDGFRWYENNGADAVWGMHVIDAEAMTPASLSVADVDGDGDLDVLSTTTIQYGKEGEPLGNEAVLWHENGGDSSTWTTHTINTSTYDARGVLAADLDGDGDADVATIDGGSTGWYVNRTIHRSAVFPQSDVLDLSSGYAAVHALDFEGNGTVELLAGENGTASINLFYDSGAGFEFGADISQRVISGLRQLASADLDRDGDRDVLVASGELYWIEWLGDSEVEHDIANCEPCDADFASVAVGDLDRDGDPDVLAGGTIPFIGDAYVGWYENDGTPQDGGFLGHGITPVAELESPAIRSVATADLDRDGDLDVIVGAVSLGLNGEDGRLLWFRADPGEGGVDFVAQPAIAAPDGLRAAAVGDIDADGLPDVAFSSPAGLSWMGNADDGTAWTEHPIRPFGFGIDALALVDLDVDGDLDLVSSSLSAFGFTWQENLDGRGTSWVENYLGDAIYGAQAFCAADVDGNASPDLLSAATDLTLRPNLGGQYALNGVSIAPALAYAGEPTGLLAVDLEVHGRSGDPVGRLASLDLRLFQYTEGPESLETSEAQAVISEIRVYRDDDSGAFEPTRDTLLRTVLAAEFDLTLGVQTVALPATEANARVAGPATFFVALSFAAAPSGLYGAELLAGETEVVDATAGIPLRGEPAPDVASGSVALRGLLVVDSSGDGADHNPLDGLCQAGVEGPCTLRAAVMEANARPGDDRIVLGPHTYASSLAGVGEDAAATGDLDVTDGAGVLVIQGAGADRTIVDGGLLDRVFDVRGGASLVLENLTVTGGSAPAESVGGGLRNAGGAVSLRGVALRGNSADSGGAIANLDPSGTVAIDVSTIAQNVAPLGSAYAGVGFLTLASSTISDNSGDGAAIANLDNGHIEVAHGTIAANTGGGIESSATGGAELRNTIVAGNEVDLAGVFVFLGHNLIGNPGLADITLEPGNGDIIGAEGAPLDAQLGPLQDNGGPTPTRLPLATSPAIDAGSCGALEGPGGARGAAPIGASVTADQRGFERPVGLPDLAYPDAADGCDIGAVETSLGLVVPRIEIPVRWCGVDGAPSLGTPADQEATNDFLRSRLDAASDGIFLPQANLLFRSAANALIPDFPILTDAVITSGSQAGDVFIDPATLAFDEFNQLIADCRAAWEEQDPTIVGITAVQIRRFVDANGAPLSVFGLGGRATAATTDDTPFERMLAVSQQMVAGRVMVADTTLLAPNPPDLVDRLAGHEIGHAISLEHGNGADDDANGRLDDNDDQPAPRFDGPNLMQYRNGSIVTVEQALQAREHVLLTVPDIALDPQVGTGIDHVPLEEGFRGLLEFGFRGLFEFGFRGLFEFGFRGLFEFGFRGLLDFGFQDIQDFGVTYDENPGGMATVFSSVNGLFWPSPIRPESTYYYYLDVDPGLGTGGKPSESTPPFPAVEDQTTQAEDDEIDLILELVIAADCPDFSCSESATLNVYEYQAPNFVLVTSGPGQAPRDLGVGLFVDNGGEAVEQDSGGAGSLLVAQIPVATLESHGWTPGAPLRLQALSTLECSGALPNVDDDDDPSFEAALDCQCPLDLGCSACPDYPGCTGGGTTPLDLQGRTRIVTDVVSQTLTLEPPVLPDCAVAGEQGAPGGAVSVTATGFPTTFDRPFEVFFRGEDVPIFTVLDPIFDPDGSITFAFDLPAGAATGMREIEVVLDTFATAARCAITVLACGDADGDGNCDEADLCPGADDACPPIADAGGAATSECTSPQGTTVTLDGSASSDPNADIIGYDWFEAFGEPGERFLGSGLMLTVTLAVGEHVITLRVTDAFGNEATDTAVIAVVDTVPPVVDCSTARVTGVDLRRVVIQVTDVCAGIGEIEVDAVLRSPDNTCAPLPVTDGTLFLLECKADRCHSDGSGAVPEISAQRPQLVVEGRDGAQGTTCIVDLCDRVVMRRLGTERTDTGGATGVVGPATDGATAGATTDTTGGAEAVPAPEPRERVKSKVKKDRRSRGGSARN